MPVWCVDYNNRKKNLNLNNKFLFYSFQLCTKYHHSHRNQNNREQIANSLLFTFYFFELFVIIKRNIV